MSSAAELDIDQISSQLQGLNVRKETTLTIVRGLSPPPPTSEDEDEMSDKPCNEERPVSAVDDSMDEDRSLTAHNENLPSFSSTNVSMDMLPENTITIDTLSTTSLANITWDLHILQQLHSRLLNISTTTPESTTSETRQQIFTDLIEGFQKIYNISPDEAFALKKQGHSWRLESLNAMADVKARRVWWWYIDYLLKVL
jgi:post-segregation antitoxin (ccd killing protein)